MISTRNLKVLPKIDDILYLCQSIALLDAIIEPAWELRYYSFNSHWNTGEMMASMRNDSGDSFYILFTPHGALIKGYAHESLMAEYVVEHGKLWPGVLDHVPEEFKPMLAEPAFSFEETTFCIWRRYRDSSWSIGNIDFPTGDDPDGSQDLLFILDGDPRTYKKWSEEYYEAEYYEREFPLSAIRAVYEHKPLTPRIITALNPDITLDDLAADIAEIGYH